MSAFITRKKRNEAKSNSTKGLIHALKTCSLGDGFRPSERLHSKILRVLESEDALTRHTNVLFKHIPVLKNDTWLVRCSCDSAPSVGSWALNDLRDSATAVLSGYIYECMRYDMKGNGY